MGEERDQWLLSKILDKEGKLSGTLLLDVACKPEITRRHRIYLTFPFEGRPIPYPQEFDQFERVDWQIGELCKKFDGQCVAIWTHQGKRDWIVYIKDPEIFLKLTGLLFKNWAEIEVEPDPLWTQYEALVGIVKKAGYQC